MFIYVLREIWNWNFEIRMKVFKNIRNKESTRVELILHWNLIDSNLFQILGSLKNSDREWSFFCWVRFKIEILKNRIIYLDFYFGISPLNISDLNPEILLWSDLNRIKSEKSRKFHLFPGSSRASPSKLKWAKRHARSLWTCGWE